MSNLLLGFTQLVLPQASVTHEYTLTYLREHYPDVLDKIDNAYSTYYVLLVLPTGLRFQSGEYYPYNLPFYEALEELESSLLLAFSGYYKSAIQHLRFLLELAYLGLYFSKPVDESWLQEWLLGKERTPSIRYILRELEGGERVGALNAITGIDLAKECYGVYDSISGYVHTRGYSMMGTSLRGSNFPMLNPEALIIWSDLLLSSIKVIALGMIARFPQALQGIPLFEKLGFARVPRGGILEQFEVEAVERIFETDMLYKLMRYSDKYHQEVVIIDRDKLSQVPDLTLVQLRASFREWWDMMKQLDQGDIPGKTWYVDFATMEMPGISERSLGTIDTPEGFKRCYLFQKANGY